jgi:hypothetical protein
MNKLKKYLKTIQQFDINNINNLKLKKFFKILLNIIEILYNDIQTLKEEIRQLKDEINRLKGEQGRPNIKANKKKKAFGKNEMENKTKKKRTKSSKKGKVNIDREEIIKIDKSKLPKDVVFKGYERKIVQEIKIITDNVLYLLEKYYSPLLKKTFIAEAPIEHQGTEFGPELKSLCSYLYYECRVSEDKILKFLQEQDIIISRGTISNILIQENAPVLSQEKEAIFAAGTESSNYQQIDDTGMRVNGKNCYATIVANNEYSTYFINDKKDRETIENIIYHGKEDANFEILVCDDAKQFHNVTDARALCWIHEERHYKKLTPFLEYHKELVENKRHQIWDYYAELKAYKENPTEESKNELDHKFDEIFNEKTEYDELDKRLKLTQSKKEYLLQILDHPEIPLHNNLSENGIRTIVIKRKISGGTRTRDGTKAWENNFSILETCKKQGISYYKYMKDIFSKKFQMLRLANLIRNKFSTKV